MARAFSLPLKASGRLFVLVVSALLLLSCQSPAGVSGSAQATGQSSASATSTPIREVTIDAADFSYALPESVPSGWLRIAFKNTGKEPHHAQLARLKDGVTLEQLQASLQKGPEAALSLVSLEGGPGVLEPGKSTSVTLNLPAGQYVALCFVESPNKVPHLAKGMIRPFAVTQSGGPEAPRPAAEQTIVLRDFGFDVPTSLSAGRITLNVVNEGPQPHELALLRLAPGKTMADLQAFMAGSPSEPRPFEEVAGMQALDTGKSGLVTLDLQSGSYVALCFIPDPGSGKPHTELGMVKEITVK